MENHRLIDNVSDSIALLRALDPELPDFCWHIITAYSPNPARSGWSTVREFVIRSVLAMSPRTHSNARRLMTMTALYVTWVWMTTGCELTPSRVFSNNRVHLYLQERLGDRSPEYRFDTARQLSKIGELTAGTQIERLRTPRQSGRARPYTSNEIAELCSWANTLSTPFKRRNARAVLALGAGAGLTAAEIMATRAEDIRTEHGRMFVRVGGTVPRTVPVRATWMRMLTASVDGRTTGWMFVGYRFPEYPPNALQQFLSRNPSTPRVAASRLHSGWVVSHLNTGLPIQVLLEITGFTSAQALQPYLTHAAPVDLDDHLSTVTGEVSE